MCQKRHFSKLEFEPLGKFNTGSTSLQLFPVTFLLTILLFNRPAVFAGFLALWQGSSRRFLPKRRVTNSPRRFLAAPRNRQVVVLTRAESQKQAPRTPQISINGIQSVIQPAKASCTCWDFQFGPLKQFGWTKRGLIPKHTQKHGFSASKLSLPLRIKSLGYASRTLAPSKNLANPPHLGVLSFFRGLPLNMAGFLLASF